VRFVILNDIRNYLKMATPDMLYAQYKNTICDIISTFPINVSDEQVDLWIRKLRDHLCVDKDGVFIIKFQHLLRKEIIPMVKTHTELQLQDQMSKPDLSRHRMFQPVRVHNDLSPSGDPMGQLSGPDMFRSHDAHVDRPICRANRSQSTGSSLNSIRPGRPIVRFPTQKPNLRVVPAQYESADSQGEEMSPINIEVLNSERIDPSTMGRSSPQPPEYTPSEEIPLIHIPSLPPVPGLMDPNRKAPKIMLPAWGPGSFDEMDSTHLAQLLFNNLMSTA
jgi:hypothetical protein